MKRRKPFNKLAEGGEVTSNNSNIGTKPIPGRPGPSTPSVLPGGYKSPSPTDKKPISGIHKDDLNCGRIEPDPNNPGYTFRYDCLPKPNSPAKQKIIDSFSINDVIDFVQEQNPAVPVMECQNDSDCLSNETCFRGVCVRQDDVGDPIIIGPQEYWCNGECWPNPGTTGWTCDNMNNTVEYGNVVYDLRQCYSTDIMPDGRRWMTENLQQVRIDDGNENSDGTRGSYIVNTNLTATSAPDLWNSAFYSNTGIAMNLYGDINENLTSLMDNTTWYNFWAADNFGGELNGICPSGWHVPTHAEITTLIQSMGQAVGPPTGIRPPNDLSSHMSDGSIPTRPKPVPSSQSQRSFDIGGSVIPPGSSVTDRDENYEAGKRLKSIGVCPGAGNCDQNNDGVRDGYWTQSTDSVAGIDEYGFGFRGYGYINYGDTQNVQFQSVDETGGIWTSTRYGAQSVGYVLTARYNSVQASLSFETHGGFGNAGDGYNIRCVEGPIIGDDDSGGDFIAWWELMEDYRFVNLFNRDEDGNPGWPWIPAEVCINDPNVPCDDVEEAFSSQGHRLGAAGPLRAINPPNSRLECPAGPSFWNPATNNILPFNASNVGPFPSGCYRTTYIGEGYTEEDIGESEPVNDIGCCDSVVQVYGAAATYDPSQGNLHNCFYLDGEWKYQCGGCSCMQTPNAFSTVYPAYHYYNSEANWGTVTLWEGETELEQYYNNYGIYPSTTGYQYGGTLGSGGHAESIGPSCPELMCVTGTYNGMYCNSDAMYGVDEATCAAGGGTCINGSGCSWGVKKYPSGAYYAAGWNPNDYSCCPGCQTPAMMGDSSVHESCINDYVSVFSDEVNWAEYGWDFSMHGHSAWDTSCGDWGCMNPNMTGDVWPVESATFEEWAVGICANNGDSICITTGFDENWQQVLDLDCAAFSEGECPTWEVGDAYIDENVCSEYTDSIGNTTSGCCGWSPIQNKCIYKGCQIYIDCIESLKPFFGTNFCVENCQSTTAMSTTEIEHYPHPEDLAAAGDEHGWPLSDTLCLPDDDQDGICDEGDIGEGDFPYSQCPCNTFDCFGNCCGCIGYNPVEDEEDWDYGECALEDDCGECNYQSTLSSELSETGWNRLDKGCGCYGNASVGPDPDDYFYDGDGDGLGSGDPELFCSIGGTGCIVNCLDEYTEKTIYQSIDTQQACVSGTPGGWCGNSDDIDLSYDHDNDPATEEIVVSGDSCPSNEVGCNGCCSNTGEFGLPVCGQFDSCGNCISSQDAPGLYCVNSPGNIECGDGVIAGDTDLSGNTYVTAGCNGICCSAGSVITTPIDGNLYDTCAYQNYFYVDTDGDGFAYGTGLGDPLCQIDGVPTGDYSTCAQGNPGGYCLTPAAGGPALDVDNDVCFCPENVDNTNYQDGSNPCYDCMGVCRHRVTESGDNIGTTLCPTDDNGNVVLNQQDGCATIDTNANSGSCPANHCIYGSSPIQDPCQLGCNGTYYDFGNSQLECQGDGVADGCNVCGGSCCTVSNGGDGCLECGCWDIATQFPAFGGFVGSQNPGEVCDCDGSVVDICGVCGGPGQTNCESVGYCNGSQNFCDTSSPEFENGNQGGPEICDRLDGCGVCNENGHDAPYDCSTAAVDYGYEVGAVGSPCNAGSQTYCGHPLGNDGTDDCSEIDGCGYCGGDITVDGISCTNFDSESEEWTTANIDGSSITITLGDYCSAEQFYCTGTDPNGIGTSSDNCTKRFDCAGGCYEYDDATSTWAAGAAIIDECGVCSGGSEGTDNWTNHTYNSDDEGCGCDADAPVEHYYDFDGDGKADPLGTPYYENDYFCLSFGNITTSDTDGVAQPASTVCGVDRGGWCTAEGVVWDEAYNDMEMWDCPCAKKDCNGVCCIDDGFGTEHCTQTTNGYIDDWGTTGPFCSVIDDCGECNHPDDFNSAMDECLTCFGTGKEEYWADEDGDGLGEGESALYCPGEQPDGYVTNNNDLHPNCTCPEDDNTCVDCNGNCNRESDGTLKVCTHGGASDSLIVDTTPGCALLDMCGVCYGGLSGNNDPCIQDCNGEWGGNAITDNCGTCDADPSNDCVSDCNGDWGGNASLDSCGVCSGGNTDHVADSDQDCNGDCFGQAFEDPNCGGCVGGNTGEDACTQDCNNDWGGSAVLDSCGVCDGGDADDVGCGCFAGEPLAHYYDTDGDGVPDDPAPLADSPSWYCSQRNDAMYNASFNGGPCSGQCPEVYCPNPPTECYECGYIGGWCTYDSANPLPGGDPWDTLPNCPCNATHCNSGLAADCCDPDGNGTCNGHYKADGSPYEQCLANDDCGNCGGSCVCSGTMGTNNDGNLECYDGDIVCPEADASPGEHYWAVGCGNVCVVRAQAPTFDACGVCGGTCDPVVPGGPGCLECGCNTVIDIMCDDNNDGIVDDNCPGGSVGSLVEGEYCNCEGQITDACGNCGGGCYGSDAEPDVIVCSETEYNYTLADCWGVCGSELIGTGVDGIGTDACGICAGPGAIYSCAEHGPSYNGGNHICGGSGLCESQLSACQEPDACGNCGGSCLTLEDGIINCDFDVNNEVVAGCDGVCSCGADDGIINYSDVNDGTCFSYDYCGFCVDHGTGYVDNGELCDNAPPPYCGNDVYYCPTGGIQELAVLGYYEQACNEEDICNVCEGPGTEIVDAWGQEVSIANGGYCPGGPENAGKVCNCESDTCDDCGICGGDNSVCNGCVYHMDSCAGVWYPCNGGTSYDGVNPCYYWGDTGVNSCLTNDGTTCNCPLGSTPCFYDGDCDGDREVGNNYFLECKTDGSGTVESCSDNNDCNPLALAACGAEYQGVNDGETYIGGCYDTQGNLGTGCRNEEKCNYDEYADLDGDCYGPGEDIYTCVNWDFQCTPNFGNGGDMLDGVQACEPGGAITDWTHWYPDRPNYTIDMNEAGCFRPIDEQCGCTDGPASTYYVCDSGCAFRDINGNATGNQGCSYYDNGFFNNPCDLPESCLTYNYHCSTSSDGTYLDGDADALGCDGTGCFNKPSQCLCVNGPNQTYVDPTTCNPDCTGGGCASDGSNICQELPPCLEFFPGSEPNEVCGGTATSCTNSDNHCYEKDYRCPCEGTDIYGDPFGDGAQFHECFGSGLAGCTTSGCSMKSKEEYCLVELQSCVGDYYGTGTCDPVGTFFGSESNSTILDNIAIQRIQGKYHTDIVLDNDGNPLGGYQGDTVHESWGSVSIEGIPLASPINTLTDNHWDPNYRHGDNDQGFNSNVIQNYGHFYDTCEGTKCQYSELKLGAPGPYAFSYNVSGMQGAVRLLGSAVPAGSFQELGGMSCNMDCVKKGIELYVQLLGYRFQDGWRVDFNYTLSEGLVDMPISTYTDPSNPDYKPFAFRWDAVNQFIQMGFMNIFEAGTEGDGRTYMLKSEVPNLKAVNQIRIVQYGGDEENFEDLRSTGGFALDCNGTGCWYPDGQCGCEEGPEATWHNCDTACGGEFPDVGCWIGDCLIPGNCTGECNNDNQSGGQCDDCTCSECWDPVDGCNCSHGEGAQYNSCDPGCGDSGCEAQCDTPSCDGYDCSNGNPGTCDNSDGACWHKDDSCPCDKPYYCECAAGCGNTGTNYTCSSDSSCSNACDPLPNCTDFNNGACEENYGAGGTVASDCYGSGCVIDDDVHQFCCQECYFSGFNSDCQWIDCADDCGASHCGDGSQGSGDNECDPIPASCTAMGYHCTYPDDPGNFGGLDSCRTDQCFNIDSSNTHPFSGCECSDSLPELNDAWQGKFVCNKGDCGLTCGSLNQAQCLSIDQFNADGEYKMSFTGNDFTTGYGCKWSPGSPSGCSYVGRGYLLPMECNHLDYYFGIEGYQEDAGQFGFTNETLDSGNWDGVCMGGDRAGEGCNPGGQTGGPGGDYQCPGGVCWSPGVTQEDSPFGPGIGDGYQGMGTSAAQTNYGNPYGGVTPDGEDNIYDYGWCKCAVASMHSGGQCAPGDNNWFSNQAYPNGFPFTDFFGNEKLLKNHCHSESQPQCYMVNDNPNLAPDLRCQCECIPPDIN